MVRKDFKFIDLNFFFRNLFGGPTTMGKVLVLLIAAAPLFYLCLSWWRLGRKFSPGNSRTAAHGFDSHESKGTCRRLLWASTITWTMVINVYMGIYDLILVVLSLLWTADVFYKQGNRLEKVAPAFKLLVFLVIVLSWISQPLARITGFQVITPVLFALAAFQQYIARKVTQNATLSLPESGSVVESVNLPTTR
jgi:hypothetical protein